MKQTIYFLLTLVTVFICSKCGTPGSQNQQSGEQAQQTEELEQFKFEPINQLNIKNVNSNSSAAFIAPATAPTCSSIPTQAEVKNGPWIFTDHFYSASQALKLGIPIVNANASHDLKVYVKDYRRAKSCTASDNLTTVIYGQVIRTVIEIENYDASVGVDLASLAANGTLKRNTQHFYFYKDGFFNDKIDDVIASVQGKTFDVQNYTLYQNVMSEVLKLLKDPKTTFSVNRIGIEEPVGPGDETLVKSPIIAYSLMSISKGNTCNKTKNKFQNNMEAVQTIEEVYKNLDLKIGDEKPSDEAITKSKKYLQGIRIRN